jgi:hypothetical protein
VAKMAKMPSAPALAIFEQSVGYPLVDDLKAA